MNASSWKYGDQSFRHRLNVEAAPVKQGDWRHIQSTDEIRCYECGERPGKGDLEDSTDPMFVFPDKHSKRLYFFCCESCAHKNIPPARLVEEPMYPVDTYEALYMAELNRLIVE